MTYRPVRLEPALMLRWKDASRIELTLLCAFRQCCSSNSKSRTVTGRHGKYATSPHDTFHIPILDHRDTAFLSWLSQTRGSLVIAASCASMHIDQIADRQLLIVELERPETLLSTRRRTEARLGADLPSRKSATPRLLHPDPQHRESTRHVYLAFGDRTDRGRIRPVTLSTSSPRLISAPSRSIGRSQSGARVRLGPQ